MDVMQKIWPTLRGALRLIGLAGLVALFAMAIFNSGGRLEQGIVAPEVRGVGMDGQRKTLDLATGKPTLINFWATWCPPCLAELPDLEKAHQVFGDRVQMVGLAAESGTPSQVADVVKRFGLSYQIVVPLAKVTQAYHVSSFPTTIIVDPQGRVATTFNGGIDFEMIQDALAPWLSDD